MKKTFYICLEGSEGTGKTTQYEIISNILKQRKFKVLKTKEPGTSLNKLTLKLRKIALDSKYENDMTTAAREYIMQAIRSIHLEKVIFPAMGKYDFIIQDRGQLSGLSYGVECGNDYENMITMINQITLNNKNIFELYDLIILFKGDVKKGLSRALEAKQEFKTGDAMENKGLSFLDKVNNNFDEYSKLFKKVKVIEIENKSINDISNEIMLIIEELINEK